ncbi:MAG: transglutaminase family protein [Pseudomonadota bacterium]
MTMRLRLSHETHYKYAEPLPYGLQQIRLTPKSRAGQSVLDWTTDIQGGRIETEFEDQHNNHVLLASVEADCQEILIRCEGDVELSNDTGIVGPHGGSAPLWLFRRQTLLTKPGPGVRGLVKSLGSDFEGDVPKLHALSNLIADMVTYIPGNTDASTTAEAAIEAGQGVCQDHAHIFIAAARLLDYPARYVSGYLMMEDRVDQEAGHAWAEAHLPSLGWVGFDISNRKSPDNCHVRVATGLDYGEAAPVSGLTFGDNIESMAVALQVQQ